MYRIKQTFKDFVIHMYIGIKCIYCVTYIKIIIYIYSYKLGCFENKQLLEFMFLIFVNLNLTKIVLVSQVTFS